MSNIDMKKFIDLGGLNRFWGNVKSYINGLNSALDTRVSDLEAIVGDLTGSGSEGASIADRINAAIAALKLPETYAAKSDFDALKAEIGVAGDEYDSESTGIYARIDAVAKAGNDAVDAVANSLSSHVNDSVAHITADERTAWNAAKSAIDTFLSDNDLTQDVVDTLGNIQDYIASDVAAADEMVKKIANLEELVGFPANDEYDVDATGLYKVIADNEKVTAESLIDLDGRLKTVEAQDVYVKSDVDDAIAAAAKAGTDAADVVAGNLASYAEANDAAVALKADKTYVDDEFAKITFATYADIDALFTSGDEYDEYGA